MALRKHENIFKFFVVNYQKSHNFSEEEPVAAKLFSKSFEGSIIRSPQYLILTSSH